MLLLVRANRIELAVPPLLPTEEILLECLLAPFALMDEIMAGRWPNASTPEGADAANTHAAARVLVVRRDFRRMVERWFGLLEEVISLGLCERGCKFWQKVKKVESGDRSGFSLEHEQRSPYVGISTCLRSDKMG